MISFNQPKFLPGSRWDARGDTFKLSYTLGVFIDTNGIIYTSIDTNSRVQVWDETCTDPIRTISANIDLPSSIFVTSNGDIYTDNGNNGRVDKWIKGATSGIVVMMVEQTCVGLFVDISENIYCAHRRKHQVVKLKYGFEINKGVIVTNNLNNPIGIFVDQALNLYVADCYNHRIQRFGLDNTNGVTVAGASVRAATTSLTFPTGVTLDGDGYLFITDQGIHRVVAQDSSGFRCLFGCSGRQGTAPDQLGYPWMLSFDREGNIFVADQFNRRVQKFYLTQNGTGSVHINSLLIFFDSYTILIFLCLVIRSIVKPTAKQCGNCKSMLDVYIPLLTTEGA